MAVLDVEIVVGPKNIGGDDSGEGATVLLEIGPAEAQHLLWPLPWDHSPHPNLASHRWKNQRLAKEGHKAWKPYRITH